MKRYQTITAWLLLWIITLVVFSMQFRLFQYPYFDYPLTYEHDGIETLKLIKHLQEFGNPWAGNTRLGFPFGSNLYAVFPIADMGPLAMLWGMANIFTSPFLVYNSYVVVSLLMVVSSAFFVFQRMQLRRELAWIGAILFAFVPYHAIRVMVGHVFLLNTFTLPLALWLSWMIHHKSLGPKQLLQVRTLYWLLPVLLLIGSFGTAYYATFSLLIWLVIGVSSLIRDRGWDRLISAGLLSAVVVTVVVLNVLPSLWLQSRTDIGSVIQRDPNQVEEFAVRWHRLLTPIPGDEVTQKAYGEWYAGAQHEQYQFVGWFGLLGFGILIGAMLQRNLPPSLRWATDTFWGSLLFATVGGGGYLVAHLVSPAIRSYGRISIVLAFIAIWAVLWWWQRKLERSQYVVKYAWWGAGGLLVLLTLFSSLQAIDPHQHFWDNKTRFDEESEFIQRVEATAQDANMAVFQLPYIPYPEGRGGCQFDSYDHFVGYIHSDTLIWSFGMVAGQEGDVWYQSVSELPPERMLPELKELGYGAVLIDATACYSANSVQEAFLAASNGKIHTSNNQSLRLIEF